MSMFPASQRYDRQIRFPGLGEEGQARLGQAKVVQVGCGGLGSTLAQCMVRAGVGRLTIIDSDAADITNLHRQFLFDEEDAEKKAPKALAAAKLLKKADSDAKVSGIVAEFSAVNAGDFLPGNDLVLDGTDNMETRYIINDWCVKHDIPWIYGGVLGATGMIMVVLPGKGPCIRCLYPDAELIGKNAPSAEHAGIINTLPAFIASLQATEAIKLLINSPDLIQDLRIADLWSGDYQRISVNRDPQCPCCGKRRFRFLESAS
ncbi:HesA/MoeB/ThiF family protein [Desulfococcaceae bacterium HSG8]|nr:HesA/MoeB/ThiF family protein [Desulfococcaceae bacterium HSG8]